MNLKIGDILGWKTERCSCMGWSGVGGYVRHQVVFVCFCPQIKYFETWPFTVCRTIVQWIECSQLKLFKWTMLPPTQSTIPRLHYAKSRKQSPKTVRSRLVFSQSTPTKAMYISIIAERSSFFHFNSMSIMYSIDRFSEPWFGSFGIANISIWWWFHTRGSYSSTI